jgi:hypothetical protein
MRAVIHARARTRRSPLDRVRAALRGPRWCGAAGWRADDWVEAGDDSDKEEWGDELAPIGQQADDADGGAAEDAADADAD